MEAFRDYFASKVAVPRVSETETDEVANRPPRGQSDDVALSQTEDLVKAVACTEADFDQRLLFSRIGKRLFARSASVYIGKYEVERLLGEGGMGRVYLCRDGDLERKVAIKRVHRPERTRAQTRLHREAVALAQLSHDNVVQVYDFGEHEGQMYIAMEYVEGQTLTEWMGSSHSREEILSLFIAAGRGLVAAHEVGLVHRDFKSDNVLLDRAGKPKVADFGLVRWKTQPEPTSESTSSPASTELTRVGTVAGTLKYMPLEQILGGEVGPHSDQFAFCMVLFDALWGELPFPYPSFRGRVQALKEDHVTVPSRHRALFRIVRRGLMREPEARWPDMGALLDALERAAARPRRLALGGALVAGAGLLLSASLMRPSACANLAADLDEVWGPARASMLDQRFAQHDAEHVEHVEHSLELVTSGLDRWSAAWLEERVATCEAMGGADPAQLATERARESCLSRQRSEVAGIVTTLAEANADTLAQAVVVVAALSAPASCNTIGEPPVPLSAELAAQTELVDERLAHARQLRLLGQRARARELLTELEPDARELGYDPSLARILGERAKLEDEAGSAIRAEALYLEAIMLAKGSDADKLALELTVERAELSVFQLANLEQAKERYAWLEAELGAHSPDPRQAARLALGNGRIALLQGDREAAASHYRAALELVEAPASYALLAQVTTGDEQRATSQRAYELAAATWGPSNPRIATYMRDHALVLEGSGDAAEAERLRERAVELLASSGAASDRALAASDRAQRSIRDGNWERAQQHTHELAELQDEFLSSDDPERAQVDFLRSTIAHGLGQTQRAVEYAQAAITRFETASTPGQRATAEVLTLRSYLANALMETGDLEGAHAQAERMLELAAPGSSEACVARLRLAELALRRGDPTAAAASLDACTTPPPAAEELVYEVLRGLADLRLSEQPAALEEQRLPPHARGRPELNAWLVEQLDVSDAELRALGY